MFIFDQTILSINYFLHLQPKYLTMEKLQLSQILVKNTSLYATRLDDKSEKVMNFIRVTKQKQEEILKLKNIDQDKLKMVVQL